MRMMVPLGMKCFSKKMSSFNACLRSSGTGGYSLGRIKQQAIEEVIEALRQVPEGFFDHIVAIMERFQMLPRDFRVIRKNVANLLSAFLLYLWMIDQGPQNPCHGC